MYNFSGIKYHYISTIIIYSILGIMLILLITFSKIVKKEKTPLDIIVAIIVIGLMIVYNAFAFKQTMSNPDISTYEGEYIKRSKGRYTFWNGTEKKRVFYLHVFVKDEVFLYDLEEGKEYKIYYEESTRIIVRVELAD